MIRSGTLLPKPIARAIIDVAVNGGVLMGDLSHRSAGIVATWTRSKCKCGKKKTVVDTQIRGENRVRFLGCRKCKCERDKEIVPLRYAPPRAY